MHKEPILALIPAWNEGAFIAPVVEATCAQLPVLVVDDGSTDETPSLAAKAGATVIRYAQNRGKGQALITGFTWAVKQGYKAVITLDADGQHDPLEIPKFITAYLADEGDLIIGRRDFRRMPFPNRYANSIGSRLLSLALKQRIYDNQNGYRIYSQRLLEVADLKTSGFELEVEVIIQAVCKGLQIGWVQIRTIYGTGKVSYFHPIKDSWRFLDMAWQAYKYRKYSYRN